MKNTYKSFCRVLNDCRFAEKLRDPRVLSKQVAKLHKLGRQLQKQKQLSPDDEYELQYYIELANHYCGNRKKSFSY